jgi:hypothetical protein
MSSWSRVSKSSLLVIVEPNHTSYITSDGKSGLLTVLPLFHFLFHNPIEFSNIKMSRSIDAFMFTLLSELPSNVSLVNDNARGRDKSENKKAVDAIKTGFTTPCQRRWESTSTFKDSQRGNKISSIKRQRSLFVDVPLVVPRRR